MNIDLEFHPRRKKPQYAAMILLSGVATTMLAAKVSVILFLVIGGYWSFLILKAMTNTIVNISKTQIIISSSIGRFQVNKKAFPMSNFYGVRNRVHWGHYKHCQTELIGRNGVFLPVRVELMTEKITPEARELKENLVETFKLESCRDFEHA
ncbi:hypothetical protein KRX52_09910 [Pseudomonas sp. MAP12]|uniref:DUF304 domain-containing protein n=1 Tax=Geopseudomonas aromaticivorans TaxID=2849492 RepID=A0ABS6MWF8_9GAMM|nr:hypothetical protein [Pseudomonas aromaticivorans]MBV2133116.1 hypothetical protein [Pseudomonas aromaticivorans]